MVLILYGNPVEGALVLIDLGNLLCQRHLFKSTAVEKLSFFLLKRPVLIHTYATWSELPSVIHTMDHTQR